MWWLKGIKPQLFPLAVHQEWKWVQLLRWWFKQQNANIGTWTWQTKMHFCAVSTKWHFENTASKSTTRSQEAVVFHNQSSSFWRRSSARPSYRLPDCFVFFPPPKGHLRIFQQVEKQARITSGEPQVAAHTSVFLRFRQQTRRDTGAFLMSPKDLEDSDQRAPQQHSSTAESAVLLQSNVDNFVTIVPLCYLRIGQARVQIREKWKGTNT